MDLFVDWAWLMNPWAWVNLNETLQIWKSKIVKTEKQRKKYPSPVEHLQKMNVHIMNAPEGEERNRRNTLM